MKISVIIPVYNAAAFIERAVFSALDQTEVAEVILIEDGSSDDSYTVCEKLAAEDPRIRLLTHPERANRGCGQTRNLGIKSASCEFVAFLDADDYYLPDRFVAERKIFRSEPEIDGVYGALSAHYYNDELRESRVKYEKLTTINGDVDPDQLFWNLIGLKKPYGHFHLDTLTLRKSAIDKIGFFSDISLHEDTDFIIRAAIVAKLKGGTVDVPVAVRGVHRGNRIVHSKESDRMHLYRLLSAWAAENGIPAKKRIAIENHLKVASIRASGRVRGSWLFVKACFTSYMFATSPTYVLPSVRHIFGR